MCELKLFLAYAISMQIVYRTRAIISRGLYTFYPIFKDQFFVFKEFFLEIFVLMYGLYSRAAYDGARTVHQILNDGSKITIELVFPILDRFYLIWIQVSISRSRTQ